MLLKTRELEPFLYPCSHEQIVFRYARRLSCTAAEREYLVICKAFSVLYANT
jgi:hypothetical protein